MRSHLNNIGQEYEKENYSPPSFFVAANSKIVKKKSFKKQKAMTDSKSQIVKKNKKLPQGQKLPPIE